MLGAVDFRRLGKDADAADAGQDIDGRAQRRIGGNARHAVGAAALQADDDLADRDRLTLQLADFLGDLGQHQHRLFHRFARTAGVLDVEMAFAGGDALLAVEGELVDLAAEADHQHAAEIRMAGIAGQRAVQHHHAVAGAAHAAALAVDDRDEAVDAGIFRQQRRGWPGRRWHGRRWPSN